ncbi:hypothetical protein TNCV_1767581 [Trichonephila clavipes]|nr:hypothetical protein TNCV_1767581 [Trichonephila clavipes]
MRVPPPLITLFHCPKILMESFTCSSLKSPSFWGNRSKCECRRWIFMLMLHPSSFKFDSIDSTSSTWSSDIFLLRKLLITKTNEFQALRFDFSN